MYLNSINQPMKKHHLLCIFFTALFFSFLINELNLSYIKSINENNILINGKSTVHSSTVWSVDNSWYLPHIENILNGEGYTLDPREPEMRVRRTPVYPLFYGGLYYLFGEKNCHFFIRYIQITLFAISAVLITLSVYFLSKHNLTWALFTGYLYAVLPFIYSYCYYTLTESLSPFLVVLSIFFFSLYVGKNKVKFLLLCGVSLGISFLNRPASGVLLAGFLPYLLLGNPFKFSYFKSIKNAFILCLFFMLTLAPWTIRNYLVSGEFIVSEKCYHGAPMSYGRANSELRRLTSCWTNPANFPTEAFSNLLIQNIENGKEQLNNNLIEVYIGKWPDKAFSGFTRDELRQALYSFNACFIQKNIYKAEHPFPLRKSILNLPCEDFTFNMLSSLRLKFISNSPINYYMLTPLITIKEVVFCSSLPHLALINPLTNHLSKLQFIAKSTAYFFNVLLFFSLFYFLVFSKQSIKIKLMLLTPITLLIFAFIVVLFRYFESRYLLPTYPLLYITLGFFLSEVFSYFQSKYYRLIAQKNKP